MRTIKYSCFWLVFAMVWCQGISAEMTGPGVGASYQVSLNRPAGEWLEGWPLANGISAVMVWGQPGKVVLSLNHVDFWRDHLGKEIDNYSSELRQVQQLMLAGKPKEANDLFYQTVNKIQIMPRQKAPNYPGACGYTNSFQPLGNLILEIEGQDTMSEYRRVLNLRDGVADIYYQGKNGQIHRQCFVPAGEDVIVFRMEAEQPVTGQIRFERPEQPEYRWTAVAKENQLSIKGEFAEGVKSFVQAVVRPGDTGRIAADGERPELKFEAVRQLTIYIAVDAGKGAFDPETGCRGKIEGLGNKEYDAIFQQHQMEHRTLMDRVAFLLEKPQGNEPADTEALLARTQQGEYSPELAELVFQMGRYLMISCNRAGRRPANLQGIWNAALMPDWDADWHLDMNIEMNHWMVNPTNLDECNLALFRQLELIIEQGRRNARQMTGCRGILFYGLIGGDANIWCAEGGFWTGAAAWLAQHYWTHYEYTLDREFLAEKVYPYLKEVGLFYKDFLIKNEDGKYITGFSFSPENVPPNGFVNNIHNTMDTALVREVTRHLLEACRILGVDQDLWPLWQDLHDNILPYPVTAEGLLKEWPDPLQEQPAHRHFSHLYPLFPGDEFSREGTPELYEAARKAVQLREENRSAYASWSFPYMACFYARLGQGDQALGNLADLARQNTVINLLTWYNVGTRLFQIEAGFGATDAIAEMLLQSQQGLIRLLPALPAAWPAGSIKGLKARGAFEVDITWKNGKIIQAAIKSLKGSPCRILCGTAWQGLSITSEAPVEYQLDKKTNIIQFDTQPNQNYVLMFD